MSDTSNQPPEQPTSQESVEPTATQASERKRFDYTTLNSLAVVSLASALSSIGAVAAIVTGHFALAQIKRSNEAGRGLAITGLVLGYLTVAGWIVFGILSIVATAIFYRDFGGVMPMSPGWFGFFELDRMGHMLDR